MHALDVEGLRHPSVTLWTVRAATELVGIGALKVVGPGHGEIKSMRVAAAHRGRGVASALLDHLVAQARARGMSRLSLETGAQPFFAPARALYVRHDFVPCGPFADYVDDPNSVYLTRSLAPEPRRG